MELADNEEAQAFMDSFFPPIAPAVHETLTNAPSGLLWRPISELEVFQSLEAAKGSTAPGEGPPDIGLKTALDIHCKHHYADIFVVYPPGLLSPKMEERPDHVATETGKCLWELCVQAHRWREARAR